MESNFQQQQQLQHQMQQAINYSAPINTLQFHPTQPHAQLQNSANAQHNNHNNRNENQANLHLNGQLRNNSIGSNSNNLQLIDINNNNIDKIKLPPANTNNGLQNMRPASRGDNQLGSQRAGLQIQQQLSSNNNNNAFAISNDQQTFQLPAGTLPGQQQQQFQYTGGPNSANASNGFQQQQQQQNNNMQPQIHFIANQQKFYAQISPDKAPLLFSEKRPFSTTASGGGDLTTNNMLANGIIAASSNIVINQQQQQQPVVHLQERANSKHGSSSKTGRMNMKSNSQGGQQNLLNPMPYLQMAAKTHTGSFPLSQMQMPGAGANGGGAKYGSSTGQLDILSQQQPHQHLVSMFQQQQQQQQMGQNQPSQTLASIMLNNNNNNMKVTKIKPGKNNIKEKEQLYEDAIKLKIQSNTYREENIKLKTKIKILENEMQKKEKAMEEFIAKMQIGQGIPNIIGGNGIISGGNSAQQTGSLFYPNSKHQMPANINGVTSNNPQQQQQQNPTSSTLMNNFMGSVNGMQSSSQKFQSDTFLVMSLKKQLKDQKQETLKKEEELEQLKKNIKTTQKVEMEVEIKAYQDELQRMRFLMEELMKEGPNHPIYQKQAQDQIRLLETQLQQQEYMMNQLRIDNTELANILRQREEEQSKKKEEKDKKVETKNELTKVKKQLKDKDKEIVKLKGDISGLRKQIIANNNAQGQSTTTDQSQNTNSNQNNNKTTDKDTSNLTQNSQQQQSTTNSDTQMKQLQKKNRELINENKVKKDKIEELDQTIKKLQERLQKTLDDINTEQQKHSKLQNEYHEIKSKYEKREKEEKQQQNIQKECGKQIQFIIAKCQHNQVKYNDLIQNCDKYFTPKLIELTKGMTKEQKMKIIHKYNIMPQSVKQYYKDLLQEHLSPLKVALSEACDIELHEDGDDFIKFNEFEDALTGVLGSDNTILSDENKEQIMEYLKVQYFTEIDRKGFEYEIGFLFKKFLEDLDKQPVKQLANNDNSSAPTASSNRVSSATSNKVPRPTTAKSNKSQQQLQQNSVSNDLKKIEEEEVDDKDEYEDDDYAKDNNSDNDDDYEDDFEVNITKSNKNKTIKAQDDKSNTDDKNEKGKDKDDEPTQPQVATINKSKTKKQTELQDETKDNDLLASSTKKKSNSFDAKNHKEEEKKNNDTERLDTSDIKRFMDEEEMLDIAEHCFIRIAEMLLDRNITTRSVFTKYSVPEQFPDGTVLDLMSPIAFLEAVKEAGMEELSEMEAACLLRVLAKPELDNAIILNEFIMIMENFGVVDAYEDDDDDDDYIRTEDEQSTILTDSKTNLKDDNKAAADNNNGDADKAAATDVGKDNNINDDEITPAVRQKDANKQPPAPLKKKKKIQINFDLLEEKGLKILRKLARFLLERYLHPREFFGPAIYKQLVKTKKRENNVDILQTKDFYLRLKIAGVRKTVKEVENLNKFLCLDTKFPHLMQVKKVIKALEEVAQGEQLKLQEEMIKKQEEMLKNGGGIKEAKEEEEEDNSGDIGEDEKKAKYAAATKKTGNNSDLIRETGGGLGLIPGGSSALTGGPHGYSGGYMGSLGGGYDYGMMRGSSAVGPSKIQMLMGFNHLNTIEEEKHETQNSAYFRDGDESHRDAHDQSNFIAKGSRILDDLDNSHSNKVSPAGKLQDNFKEEEEDNYDEEVDDDKKEEDKQDNGGDDDKDEYEEDDDEYHEEDKDDKHDDNQSIQDMKSVDSDHNNNNDIDDKYEDDNNINDDIEESQQIKQQSQIDNNNNKQDSHNKSTDQQQVQKSIHKDDNDDIEEEESDYEI